MSDFSQYGGVAADWTHVTALQPDVPPPQGISPIELRRLTNEQRNAASKRITESIEDVLVQDYTILSDGHEIPLRVYRKASITGEVILKKRPVYIWYHGGGFLFGSLDAEDGHCFTVARTLDIVVVHVCYRHTPEYQWPCQLNDATAGLNWVYENMNLLKGDESKVIVAGRSAGGMLAAGVVLRDRVENSRTRVQGQILDIPMLCHTTKFPTEQILAGKLSSEENRNAPLLPASRLDLFESLIGQAALTSHYYNILLQDESSDYWKDIPVAHIHIAGRDYLRDQAFLYVQKLQRVGVPVTFDVYPGMPHGFKRYERLEASKKWDEDHLNAVKKLLHL